MRTALITDNHFGARSDSKIFHEIFRKFYTEVFFPRLEAEGIKVIIVLGDFFDRRKFINFESLQLAKDIFFNLARDLGIEVYMICGNHDVVFKNTNRVNSLQLLTQEYANVHVFANPEEVVIDGYKFLFLPWMNSENYAESLEKIQKTDAKTVISHLEMKGFEYQAGLVSEHGHVEQDLLETFDFVLSGHYHKKSSRGNIHYLGTPYQLTWADYGDPRGFHLFDGQTLQFIPNPEDNFHRFVYNDSAMTVGQIEKIIRDPETFRGIEGKYVRVVVESKQHLIQYEMFLERIYESGPQDIIVNDETNYRIELEESLENFQEMSTQELLVDYVENRIQTDLDKSQLRDKLLRLYNEALKESDGE